VVATRQRVTVRLTVAQALRCEKLATYLWPQEKLTVEEISRRLLWSTCRGRNPSATWWSGCESPRMA
jgi:hypothetical protein